MTCSPEFGVPACGGIVVIEVVSEGCGVAEKCDVSCDMFFGSIGAFRGHDRNSKSRNWPLISD